MKLISSVKLHVPIYARITLFLSLFLFLQFGLHPDQRIFIPPAALGLITSLLLFRVFVPTYGLKYSENEEKFELILPDKTIQFYLDDIRSIELVFDKLSSKTYYVTLNKRAHLPKSFKFVIESNNLSGRKLFARLNQTMTHHTRERILQELATIRLVKHEIYSTSTKEGKKYEPEWDIVEEDFKGMGQV